MLDLSSTLPDSTVLLLSPLPEMGGKNNPRSSVHRSTKWGILPAHFPRLQSPKIGKRQKKIDQTRASGSEVRARESQGRRMAMASAPACAASELVAKGRRSAAFLQAMLGQQPASGAGATPHGVQDLADEILRCCDRALAALHGATVAAAGSAKKRKPEHGPAATPGTSSKRIRLSGGERAIRRVEKKWTMEDGFIWRKYGQKDIHGSKYPRLYFRCTYKEDHGCMARRQVQQSEADPSVYLINYFGEHTCCRDDDIVAESPAPFVINFGASTRRNGHPSGSPWLSCNEDDGGPVASETSDLCHSPEEKELPAGMGNEAELIGESTPEPELTSMSSPEWDPLDGCLVWDIGFGESLFDDIIGEFTALDYVGLFQ